MADRKKHRRYFKKTAAIAFSVMLCCLPLSMGQVAAADANPNDSQTGNTTSQENISESQKLWEQWKTTAVQKPASGELVPAGPIVVEWNALSGLPWKTKSYSVYLDDELQGEIQAEEGGSLLSYEVYTTKTAAHKVKIEALLENDETVTASIRTFFVSKKGLGIDYNQEATAVPQDLALSWYYNWGTSPNPNSKVKDGLEFVPMIWGAWSDFEDGKVWLASEENQKYGTVLGFNEPDLESQSNVSVEKAAEYQKYFTESGLRIGSPAISGMPAWYEEGKGWFTEYTQLVDMNDIDFIAFHTYPGWTSLESVNADVADYLKNLDKTYEMYHKPIWITEFAIANFEQNESWHPFDGTVENGNAAVQQFMGKLIAGLEERDYVERYAWQQFDMYDWAGGASCLYNENTGELTTLGNIYRNSGNPSGYVLPDLDGTPNTQNVSDEYVKEEWKEPDDGSEENPGDNGKPSDGNGNVPGDNGKPSDGNGNVPGDNSKPSDGNGNVPGDSGKPSDGNNNISGNGSQIGNGGNSAGTGNVASNNGSAASDSGKKETPTEGNSAKQNTPKTGDSTGWLFPVVGLFLSVMVIESYRKKRIG